MSNNLTTVIQSRIGNKTMPVVDLVKTNPEVAAMISKLVRSTDRPNQYDHDGNKTITAPDQMNFANISRQIAEKSKDAENVNELFPDMELSAQILISSILSPKDMAKTELNFIAPSNLRSTEISASLLAVVKEFFETDYKIEPLLPKILRQALFETGSYPMIVIPESSVDALINGNSKVTLEGISELTSKDQSTFKSIGILGGTEIERKDLGFRAALENYSAPLPDTYKHQISFGLEAIDKLLVVTDNPDILKSKNLISRFRKSNISDKIYAGKTQHKVSALENHGTRLNDSQLSSLMYKSSRNGAVTFAKVKTADESSRKTIGAPLIMKLPSEAVIPVFTPGNEDEHVGYFVLLDGEGNPLSKSSNVSSHDDLQSRLNNASNSMSSVLLNKAKSAFSDNCTQISVNQATHLYADIVESDLLARLRNGVYGTELSIGRNEEVYRIMLSRVFRNQYTQLLYVPKELITYFAYKFDNRGIGKSISDDLRILNSLRAMVLFSKVMASLKNSIGRTEVKLKLDERDPNPQKTIETAMHEVSKTRQQMFPLGMNSPSDLVEWVQRSGLEYSFSGHPGLPDVGIEFSEKNSNYTMPASDLEDDLRKRAIMSTGLSPETVDNGFSAEFATTVVSNNLLLAKRVMQIQEIFVPQVTDFARKIIFNHGTLMDKLVAVVQENFDKLVKYLSEEEKQNIDNRDMICSLIVSEFISNIEATLPQPNSITLENQMAAYDAYAESLDKVLSNYISSDIMSSAFVGQVSERVDEVKAIVKAYFCRKWLSENNVLPELAEMTVTDEDGKPLLDFMQLHGDHMANMMKSLVSLIAKQKPLAEAADNDLEKIGSTEPAADLSDTGSDTGDETGTGDMSPEENEEDLSGTGPGLPDLDSLDDPTT